MTEPMVSPWWPGQTVDHLYGTCPAVRRSKGRRVDSEIDPLGGDVCGWCLRVWKAHHPEASP